MTGAPAGLSRPRQARRRLATTAVVVGPGRVELRRLPVPEPGPGQVRIELEGCGLCGSNVPIWEGRDWFDYPQVPGAPGHEGWGRIDGIGDGVTEWRVGQRVAALTQHAFAEYDVAGAGSLVALPDEFAGSPVPGEPLGCAMNVFRRSSIRAGHTVAIIGIGFLGALLTQLASRAGARVIAVSRRDFSLDVARSCGAAKTFSLVDPQRVIADVTDLTNGALCDRVIEATGRQAPLDLAAALTREHGRLVIAGFHQDGLRHVDMSLWNWRGLDVINAHERDPAAYVRGMCAALRAVADGVLTPQPLYTHTLSIDELNTAFDLAASRPDGFLKALVRP